MANRQGNKANGRGRKTGKGKKKNRRKVKIGEKMGEENPPWQSPSLTFGQCLRMTT